MEDVKEVNKEESKTEVKKVECQPEIPVVGIPKNEYIYHKIKERKITANIYSFLPLNSLIEALQVNRHSYKLFTDTAFFEKDIMKWSYTKQESTVIHDFYSKLDNKNDLDEKLRTQMYPEFYSKESTPIPDKP